MIDINKRYRYRNGEDARILCVDRPHEKFKVVSMSKLGILEFHTINGTTDYDHNTDFDLVEVKEKKVLWALVYKDGSCYCYETKEEAYEYTDVRAIVKVEYEDGQFDE